GHRESFCGWLPVGEASRADRVAPALVERGLSVASAGRVCVAAALAQALGAETAERQKQDGNEWATQLAAAITRAWTRP
ncbi:hypothetical protein ACI4A9_28845, partial [Klebsiella pneumoniae]